MKNHNYKHGMFTSSLARRVRWLGLIALLAGGLLLSASAQNNNRKVPPRTPRKQKIQVEKQTNINASHMQMVAFGSLKGRVGSLIDISVSPSTGSSGEGAKASTKEDGSYVIENLKPGRYNVKLQWRPGRESCPSPLAGGTYTVTIRAGKTSTLNFGMNCIGVWGTCGCGTFRR